MHFVRISLALAAVLWAGVCAGAEPFVVHEWGVYVRSIVIPHINQGHGKTIPSTLLTAPRELLNGLPDFVLRHETAYTPRQEHRAWDKPVLHLYGPEGLAISVEVRTPQGHPLAYWPKPNFIEEINWRMGSGVSAVNGLVWNGTLAAQAPAEIKSAREGHWWNALREVPGMWFKTAAGSERFIFYEASAVQQPTLQAWVAEDMLKLTNHDVVPTGRVLVLFNDGNERHFLVAESVPGNGSITVSRADLMRAPGNEAELLTACRAQWESFGMTAQEASAIVESWKPDLLNHLGLMVLSRMPEILYEQMFPLTIKPAPDKRVRAGVIFDHLPGNAARASWFPRLEASMKAWALDLGADDFAVRRRAADRFAELSDLAAPFLETLQKQSTDVEIRTTAKSLLDALEPVHFNVDHFKRGAPRGKKEVLEALPAKE